jgi:hypothetical protein
MDLSASSSCLTAMYNFTALFAVFRESFPGLLHRHFGFYPNANIYALNGQYYINIENQSFLISQQEFIELFINSHNKNIKI